LLQFNLSKGFVLRGQAQIVEIVLSVALNVWTNYVNVVAQTDIDFPVVRANISA